MSFLNHYWHVFCLVGWKFTNILLRCWKLLSCWCLNQYNTSQHFQQSPINQYHTKKLEVSVHATAIIKITGTMSIIIAFVVLPLPSLCFWHIIRNIWLCIQLTELNYSWLYLSFWIFCYTSTVDVGFFGLWFYCPQNQLSLKNKKGYWSWVFRTLSWSKSFCGYYFIAIRISFDNFQRTRFLSWSFGWWFFAGCIAVIRISLARFQRRRFCG